MTESTLTVLPQDIHNRKLLDNVHPADWENPRPRGTYDLLVLGAGTAGLVTAAGAAALGAKVAIVERRLMGGDCLNIGCVPSKSLIRSGRAIADIREAGKWGIEMPSGVSVDFSAVMERMRRLRAEISPNDSAARFRDMGIDVFLGNARFSGPRTVELDDGTALPFSRAVVATGSRPIAPPIAGLEETGYLTNETLFSLTELPRRLAVVGAGPIGCEMAQAFARFGSQVFLLERTGRVLPKEVSEASDRVQKSLSRDGVTLITDCGIELISPVDGEKRIRYRIEGGVESLSVDEILVGTGRAPTVEGLGLEAAGVAFDTRNGITVNDYLQTTNRRVYAAGDVCFPYKFTHTAEALAAIAIRNALFFRSAKSSSLTIPWCTYTDPEVAHTGLTEEQAEERGIAVDVYMQSFHEVDRALLDGEEEGFVRVLTRKGRGEILGATIVARHAGEMISEITVAMAGKLGLGDLSGIIHPYPTQAESIKKAGRQYLKTRLTPLVKKIMQLWVAARR